MASASLVRRGGASGRFSATCVACDGVTVVAGAPTGSLRLLRARRQRQEGAVAGAPAWDLELVRIVAPVGDALSAREAPTAVALRDTEGLAALGGASGLVRFVSVAAQDAGAQRLRPLTALRGAALVALEFGAEGAALAAADASGRVVVFWRSGALEGDPEAPFAQVHTVALRPQPQAVVQLSFDATVGMGLEPESDSPSSPTPPLLVASTRHFAVVVDAARKAHSAVGTKPRDAPLGAVFHRQAARAAAPAGSDQAGCEAAAILAARPGRRLWIAAASGRVLGTLKLPALGAEGPQAFGSLHALGPLVLSVAGSGVAVVDPVAARTLCAFPIAAAAAAAAPELGLAYVLERAEGSSDARLWVLSAPCTAAEYAHAARAAGDIALAESAEARVAALAIASTPEEAPPPPSFELASTSGGARTAEPAELTVALPPREQRQSIGASQPTAALPRTAAHSPTARAMAWRAQLPPPLTLRPTCGRMARQSPPRLSPRPWPRCRASEAKRRSASHGWRASTQRSPRQRAERCHWRQQCRQATRGASTLPGSPWATKAVKALAASCPPQPRRQSRWRPRTPRPRRRRHEGPQRKLRKPLQRRHRHCTRRHREPAARRKSRTTHPAHPKPSTLPLT